MRLLLVPLALVLAARPGLGQTPGPRPDASTHVGNRVRVTAPSLGLRGATGLLEDMRADTLVVSGVGMVPRGAITELWVSTGRGPASEGARRGATVGALIGGGISLVLVGAGIVHDLDGCRDCFMPMTVMAMMGGVVITGGATAVGALVGTSAPPEAWRRVEVPGSVGPGSQGSRRALRLGLAVSF